MKQCNNCKRILDEKCFSKNKNNPDGLSYYCRECTKKKQDLHLFMQDGKEIHEQVIIDELKKHNIPLKVIHIKDKQSAQNVPAPVTTYALFENGKFITQGIQSDKKFLALAEKCKQ